MPSPAYGMLMMAALAALIGMFGLWVYAMRHKNAGWVDVGWVMSLGAMAAFYAVLGPGLRLRKNLMFFMVFFWAFRLYGHLIQRFGSGREEDKRYQKIRRDFGAKAEWKFLGFFLFQAIVAAALSWPFLVAAFDAAPQIHGNEWLGFIVWAAAVSGEALADSQLKAFKADPSNRGKVCEAGLWHTSRHPNYFFESLIWFSYVIFTFRSPGGLFSVLPAALMLYFLVCVSGVPPAEAESLATRGDAFRRYQRTTSVFIPWFKKK